MRRYSIILGIFISASFVAQVDPINQYDIKGKKNGYWIKYFDSDLNPTDSASSYFYGYEFYDQGKPIFKLKHDKRNRTRRHLFIDETSKKGNPRVLDGTFVWYDKSDSLPEVITRYKNGYPLEFTVYHQCESHQRHITEYLDFSRTYNNTTGSFYHEFESQKYWFRKVGTKWKSTKIE